MAKRFRKRVRDKHIAYVNPCFRKEEAQKRHGKNRAKERFDIDLSDEDLARIIAQIKRGESEFVRRQSERLTLHRVVVGESNPVVVYDRKRKTIVTFLPE